MPSVSRGSACTSPVTGSPARPWARCGADPEAGPTGATAVGFTVLWNNEACGDSHSVTTWSGQLQHVGGEDVILTQWLLTVETSPTDAWQSTLIGTDTFRRAPATTEQMALRRARGPASHPRQLTEG